MRGATRARVVFVVALLLGFALFLVGWTLLWLFRGSYLTSLITLGGAVYAAGIGLHMALVLRGDIRARIAFGPEGTTIRPPKILDNLFLAASLAALFAAVAYLVFLPFGLVDLRMPDGVKRADLAVCIFFITFNVPALVRTYIHGGEGHLRVNPDGFEVWNGFWGSFVRGKWNEVSAIQDRPLRGRNTGRGVIVIGREGQRTAMFMSDTVTDDSDALREWVRFYWEHPDYRDELVDDRGLRRLEEQKFTVG